MTTETLYEKCGGCHLFVHDNPAFEVGSEYAELIHGARGDDGDDAIEATHEASRSGLIATLQTWKRFGPPQMRERFLPDEFDRKDVYPPDRVGVALMMGEPWEKAKLMSWGSERLLEEVREADAAAEGDSFDSEISALSGALETALARWPEITVEARS